MTKKTFYRELTFRLEPATITVLDDSCWGNFKFIISLSWCNGLFIRDIYRTNCRDKLEKAEAKYNRWLAEFQGGSA